MEPIETFEVNGKTVKIYQDDDPESPREWSNVGHMVCWHRRSNLGDEQVKPGQYGATVDDVKEYLKRERKALVVLPIYIYQHSGITITSREEVYATYPDKQWDAGQVGFIYATAEQIKLEWGEGEDAEEKATAYLKGEVDCYDQYLQGDIYGYVVTDAEGEHLDSCWGYYGMDEAKEQGTQAAQGGGELEGKEENPV